MGAGFAFYTKNNLIGCTHPKEKKKKKKKKKKKVLTSGAMFERGRNKCENRMGIKWLKENELVTQQASHTPLSPKPFGWVKTRILLLASPTRTG